MSTVMEIKEVTSRLAEDEQEQLLAWLLDRESAWDEQIARDASEGKLDFLIEQAQSAIGNGKLKDWPGRA